MEPKSPSKFASFFESVQKKIVEEFSDIKEEFQETGLIRDPSFIQKTETYNPWQFPEDPFNYVGLVSNPNGIGTIPSSRLKTQVAIIGAGASGMVAAFELLKIGIVPVIYEISDRIGGRNYTYHFKGDPNALAEIGSMRIPPIHYTAFYYLKYFNIPFQPFPDPLQVPTMIYFNQKQVLFNPGDKLPPELEDVSKKWSDFISPIVQIMEDVWDDPIRRSAQWRYYVQIYAGKSFYQVLSEIQPPWTAEEISLFGSMGVGSGGFDSLYQISFIEILRIIVCKWEDEQQLIVGGTNAFEENFWNLQRQGVLGNLSVAMVNNYVWKKGVTKIQTNKSDPTQPVLVTDSSGNTVAYAAVILSPSLTAIETGIEINNEAFSSDVWRGIRNVHQMSSGKVFIRTQNAFWDESKYPKFPRLYMTITDLAFRQLYLFQFENTQSGVVLLSYTWDDSAIKFDALSETQRVDLCVRLLNKMYPAATVEFLKSQIQEIITWQWEEAPGYNGAFKLTYPGQYDLQWALFNQTRNPSPGFNNGLYLAGESTSWAGGWTEGALHSGLNAAMSVIYRLGGTINTPPKSSVLRTVPKRKNLVPTRFPW